MCIRDRCSSSGSSLLRMNSRAISEKRVNGEYRLFSLSLIHILIAAGQGLSYEAVSLDMSGATYSSARQNAIEDENTYTEDVELLTDFMSEVYETFVISLSLIHI